MKIDDAKIRLPKDYGEKDPLSSSKKMGVFNSLNRKELIFVSIEEIIPYENQARKIFDEVELESLSKSIKDVGVLNPLILIRSDKVSDKYEVISGERRWRAAKLAGLSKVPCFVLENKNNAEKIAIIDNLQREDLHPVELAKAYNNLIEKGHCSSMQDVADMLDIAKSKVVEALSLLKLPVMIQDLLLDKGIKSRIMLRRVLKAATKEEMLKILSYKDNDGYFEAEKKVTILVDSEQGTIKIRAPKNLKLTKEQVQKVVSRLEDYI